MCQAFEILLKRVATLLGCLESIAYHTILTDVAMVR